MPERIPLRVRAVPTVRVQPENLFGAHGRTVRYIGWRFDETARDFVPSPQAVEIPDSNYNRAHVADGSLASADVATAKRCGVKFNPIEVSP